MPVTDGRMRIQYLVDQGVIPALVVLASSILALALGFFLFIRFVGGAFAQPLAPWPLIATALVLLIWAVAVSALLPHDLGRSIRIVMPLCVVLLFAVACSYPVQRWVDWFAWSLVIVSIFAVDRLRAGRNAWTRSPGEVDMTTELRIADDDLESQTVLQQITRSRDALGRQALQGNLVAEIGAGERQTTLFVAFCPPFEWLPSVETEIADDSPAEVKLTQILHNGVQIEVRLNKPAVSDTCVPIDLFALDGEPQ